MPEYQSPGVYVEEVDNGSKSVEGVSTSTAGFLGETERGPVDPKLITSFSQFEQTFGGSPEQSDLDAAVDGFFRNGGSRCYIGRVTGEDRSQCATATVTDEEGNDVIDVEAVGPGNWGGRVAVIIEDGPLYQEGQNEYFKVTLRYWAEDPDEVDDPAGNNPEPRPEVEETYDEVTSKESASAFFTKKLASSTLVNVEQAGTGRPATGVTWLSRGESPSGTSSDGAVRADGDMAVPKEDDPTADIPDDDELEEMTYSELQDVAEPFDINRSQKKDDLLEDIKEVRDSDDHDAIPDGGTVAVEEGQSEELAEAEEPEVTFGDFEGNDRPGERTGLAAFEEHDDISIVCIPDENDYNGLTQALVAHCENMGDRFAILQAEQNAGRISKLEPPVDSSYAAFYYPWIEIKDPVTNRERLVPPGGHIAGIFARNDAEGGVHESPANEVVRGALDLQHDITKGEQDVLNPKGVNCIRSFQGRGIRVWGARTASSDPSWKYINVRRLFLYIEQSIDEGTQWTVFETNDRETWARVRETVESFLTNLYREGALMGSSPDEAFYVECGEETMTQDDIDNGRLIVEIGIAPVKPAEFVIFRIGQWTNDEM